MGAKLRSSLLVVSLMVVGSGVAHSQPLGTFRWQLSPFCNVLTLSVTQNGSIYRLEGYDDQCGATTRAPVIGMAVPNANGSIEFGLTVVVAPGGAPVHVDVVLTVATLGGTWRDSSGNSGTLVYSPSSLTGSARPAPTIQLADGSVATAKLADGAVTTAKIAAGAVDASRILDGSLGSADVNTTQVQQRVAGVCATGTFVQSVNQDGTVVCGTDSAGSGDITGVAAGSGLSGGGTTGDVTLSVSFAGNGTATTAARSDHGHDADITAVAAGTGLTGGGTTGDVTLNVSFAGTGTAASAARSDHTHAADITGVAAGTGLTGGGTAGDVTVSANFAGSGAAATIARSDHTHQGTIASNTAVGLSALGLVTTGAQNTALGSEALSATTSGFANVGVGALALVSNTTGQSNTAVGNLVLAAATTASGNTAVGTNALTSQTTGDSNTAIGVGAMQVSTTSTSNVAIGTVALNSLTSGSDNVAVGTGALAQAVGNNNIGLGRDAGAALVAGNNNIYVGNVGAPETSTIRVGGVVHTRTFIAGIRGVTTDNANAIPVLIDSSGQLGTVSSSRRVKEDITPLERGSDVQRLRPVQFRYIQPTSDGSKPLQYGLIAEEVAEVNPLLVALDADGQIETVKYHLLPTLLVAEVQRLEKERTAQAAQIAELTRVVEALREAVAKLTTVREQ